MGKGRVTRIAPPFGALSSWYDNADLVDSYELKLPSDAPRDARLLARAMLGKPSLFVDIAMRVRDVVVRPFGVKTSAEIRNQTLGSHIDFSPVLSENNCEVILGEDDYHLDFRIELAVLSDETRRRFVVTSVVRCHNSLGRVYLHAIRPLHKRIATGALRRLDTQLSVLSTR